ncbi:glycosyltransferase [Synechococcus sp. Nb3U1]|uniref:glycosyltransferase family 2 protein n=1 Tax=Synechococcus sp. Nb3U1 TaxID=1914529 RepID=UPI001F233B69|nr:glycosyltransferase [Synechococcus sp. Nb3U1]MCF2971282.1 glycosyltransferase [Synechococcus sp. Nb3U1]
MLQADLSSNPEQPQVTLVVVPRERFSCTQASLESLYAYTRIPFHLIYVDGNSPPHIGRYLKEQSQARGFQLIRTEHYLSPNQARNMGWEAARTPYMAFVDNDVIVSPGWLESMLQCAEETGAAIVGPLMCEREPIHTIVHCAGGENYIWQDGKGSRHLREKMYKQGQKVEQVRAQLQAQPTELAEFHCMFLRTDLREKVGFLDEGMLNTKEHLDFCMTVTAAGELIYFEPNSLVTYVPGPPADWSDVAFYMLRWSNHWTQASLEHLRQKWDLAEDSYFKTKLKKLGWRRRMTLWQPLNRILTRGRTSDRLNQWVLYPLDRFIEGWLTRDYQRRNPAQRPQLQTQDSVPSSGKRSA